MQVYFSFILFIYFFALTHSIGNNNQPSKSQFQIFFFFRV